MVIGDGDSLILIEPINFETIRTIHTHLNKNIISFSTHQWHLLLHTEDKLLIFEKLDGNEPAFTKLLDRINSANFLELGGQIAIGGWNFIKIFDQTLCREIYSLESAHQGKVVAIVDFISSPGVIASVGQDGLVKLWSKPIPSSSSSVSPSPPHAISFLHDDYKPNQELFTSVDSLDALFGVDTNSLI